MAVWPWTELGIGVTTDKEAIREAFADRRAALGGNLPISAYARLTEAREKALFLASEMQRTSERAAAEETSVDSIGPAVPPHAADAPPIPDLAEQPHPAPHFDGPNTIDPQDDVFDEPEPDHLPASYTDPSYHEEVTVDRPDGRVETVDAPGAFRDMAALVKAFVDAQFKAHVSPEQRRWLMLVWPFGVLGFFAFLMAPDGRNEPEPVTKLVAQSGAGGVDATCTREGDKTVCFEETFSTPLQLPSGIQLDEMVEEIFGTNRSPEEIAQINAPLYHGMLGTLAVEGIDGVRAHLRRHTLAMRDKLPSKDVIAVNRLYLDWLRTSRALGGSQCLEVVTWAFFDGVPAMDEVALSRERALMSRMLGYAGFGFGPEVYGRYRLPEDLAAQAGQKLGLTGPEAAKALENTGDIANCDVRIALLEIMLEDPAGYSRDLFRRI